MYNLKQELKALYEKLKMANDHSGAQAVSQALIRIENLEYDIEVYEQVFNNRKRL